MSSGEIIYEGARVCQVEDTAGLGEDCKWPSPNITWGIQSSLPHFIEDDFKRHVELAWSYWTAVCGIKPRFATSGVRNVMIGLQTIGPGGVLADMQLPCGVTMSTSLRMRLDTAEKWVVASNPGPSEIDLIRVLAHELGHAIGMPHIAGRNLMAATYSSSIRKPQENDIYMGRSRYGLPVPDDDPVPPPVDPPSGSYEEVYAILKKGSKIFTRTGGVVFESGAAVQQ